jgi:hypothetical protein
MKRAMARTIRRLLALATASTFAAAVAACVLAQPSGDIPQLPASRPTIDHSSVVPSTATVLTTWPRTFNISVELVDPTAPFVYASFIDYNPLTGEGRVDGPTVSAYEASKQADRKRSLEIAIPAPADLQRCHVVEVVVALSLNTRDNKNAHTPDEPGGDLVAWFYNPNGDLGGCPSLDAGFGAPDGDASDGGDL